MYADDKVALVIGNGAYSGNVSPLKNATSDAIAIESRLQKIGFNIISAIDKGQKETLEALKIFGKHASEAKVVLVFFAGHAIQVDGENYLLPIDFISFDNSDKEGLNQLIPLSQIMKEVEKSKDLGIVILDACRNNPFEKDINYSQRGLQRELDKKNILTALAPVKNNVAGTLVAYSTKHGHFASDGDKSKNHSPYTQALLDFLNEESDIRLTKLFDKVRDRVLEVTDNKQQPYVYSSLGVVDWYIPSFTPIYNDLTTQSLSIASVFLNKIIPSEANNKLMTSFLLLVILACILLVFLFFLTIINNIFYSHLDYAISFTRALIIFLVAVGFSGYILNGYFIEPYPDTETAFYIKSPILIGFLFFVVFLLYEIIFSGFYNNSYIDNDYEVILEEDIPPYKKGYALFTYAEGDYVRYVRNISNVTLLKNEKVAIINETKVIPDVKKLLTIQNEES